MEKDKASIISAILVFESIVNDLSLIGQSFIDNGVDYRFTRRLQTIDLKLVDLINEMKGDLK